MKIRLHYNKHRAKEGLPWTIHTSKKCIPAAHVTFEVPLETEEKPEKRDNPRYFLVTQGEVHPVGEDRYVVR